jgi:uncharacterized protein YhaN
MVDDSVSEYKKKYRDLNSEVNRITKEKKEFELQARKLQAEIDSNQNNEELMELMVLEKDEAKAEVEELKKKTAEQEEKIGNLQEEIEF